MAGLGFSVAYFFDPARGRARRKRVVDLIRPALRSHVGARVAPDAPARVERAAPDLPRIGLADHGPRPTFLRATDGIRASARV
jgi:hypothetical protein